MNIIRTVRMCLCLESHGRTRQSSEPAGIPSGGSLATNCQQTRLVPAIALLSGSLQVPHQQAWRTAHSGQFPELHASLLAPACLAEVLSCPVFPQLFARLVPGVAQDISGRFYSPSQNPEAGQDAAVPFSLRAPEAGGVPANNEA